MLGLIVLLIAALGPLGTAGASEVVVYTARHYGQEPTNVPASLRDPDNRWFGLTVRARTIMYSTGQVKPAEPSTYEANRAGDK